MIDMIKREWARQFCSQRKRREGGATGFEGWRGGVLADSGHAVPLRSVQSGSCLLLQKSGGHAAAAAHLARCFALRQHPVRPLR